MSSRGWTPPSLLAEAWRNTVSGRWFSFVLVLVFLGITVGALLFDAQTVASIHSKESRFLAAGGNLVLVTRADSEAHVDSAACAGLQRSSDVIASSAVTSREGGAAVTGRPEAIQSVYYATAGFEKIVGSDATLGANQAISSRIIAERWRMEPGANVGFTPAENLDAIVQIVDVADMERLGDAFSTAMVMLAPAVGPAESCYVLTQPWATGLVVERAPALLGDSAKNPLRAGTLQSLGEFTEEFDKQYASRTSQYAPVVAGLSVGLIAALLMWIRRGRYALYSTLGMSYGQVVQLRLYEWFLLVFCAVLPGTAIPVVIAASTGVGATVPTRYWAESMPLHGALIAFSALFVVALVSPFKPAVLAALKER